MGYVKVPCKIPELGQVLSKHSSVRVRMGSMGVCMAGGGADSDRCGSDKTRSHSKAYFT